MCSCIPIPIKYLHSHSEFITPKGARKKNNVIEIQLLAMSGKWNIWICEIYALAQAHALKGYAIQTHTHTHTYKIAFAIAIGMTITVTKLHSQKVSWLSVLLSRFLFLQCFKWMQSCVAPALNQMISGGKKTSGIRHTNVLYIICIAQSYAIAYLHCTTYIYVTDSNEHWNCNELCMLFSFSFSFFYDYCSCCCWC